MARRGGRPTLEEAAKLDDDVRDHALRLFLEHGYEGASMDAIARAAGTTKASLYARFPSKEALFDSVLGWAIQRSDWPVPEPDPPDLDDLEGALTSIAHASLQRALDPAVVKLGRIAIAQASRFPDIARRSRAGAFWRLQLVVELLERHAATGAIVADEPEILAEHFLAMVAGMPARLASLGIARDAADEEHRVEVAVQLFLRSLHPG
jgi:AcrR family transcriptional regulator